ncbi:metal-dependent phosphohydrolase [Catellatospora sp. KI3]|uniref:HD domain-containing protein n=1 Tax=Catellatospora sp. KI3 TaxID=3041620 RepID=UPI0024826180|nr:metal-dependent phosphohydrolase [Catellatospora sp. KI3]MDI1465802.1 metal-dependent phosphohydrolase [Catellatospora sp. KI3]
MVEVARFAATARAAGATAPDDTLTAVGTELVNRWSEPHRYYHSLSHLAATLDLVDDPVVALALWGHDAIYDPTAADNEERSAELTAGLLAECGLPAAVVEEAVRLVRLTAGHRVDPADRTGTELADADLAILAVPWPDYCAYVAGVRAEYAHVPDELWQVGRATVLRNLLSLPALYHHHPAWESAARANLTRELSALHAPG